VPNNLAPAGLDGDAVALDTEPAGRVHSARPMSEKAAAGTDGPQPAAALSTVAIRIL
jgi:hypothetical protein